MKKLIIFSLIIFSSNLWSHGGERDESVIKSNSYDISMEQVNFYKLQSKSEQLDNLDLQLDKLRENIKLLQQLMGSDYPHVQEKYSKYKLDYINELKKHLEKMDLTLKQTAMVIEQNKSLDK